MGSIVIDAFAGTHVLRQKDEIMHRFLPRHDQSIQQFKFAML